MIYRSMHSAAPFNPLTVALQGYRERCNKSQAEIARDAWLDESYVSRLFSGERTRPSRDALILLLAFGMGLPIPDTDEVLLAADYKPLAMSRVG
ncbi:MAG: helix-turn-helix domain-containing protein [Dehalococcoidia bacterium]|nr:helix-turn-helix domain-containing protein [Dehalococcoidia bacterium]